MKGQPESDPSPGFDRITQVSAEAREFAEREHLSGALDTAIDLVNEHFTLAGSLSVSLEFHPEETDAPHLVIEAPVSGDPIAVSDAHWLFAVEAAKSLGIHRARINLVCDIR